ncbi:cation diffusion facilitator family transporter [Corynebacterium guangdongense]|uniref:Cation diffusion facilitator family transporter n=1 Tax=Corynebacterium guangdongense TaxID=1783348 RepID=A0ABU2A216_9CORY|nr:cation diffusion facilitator family transporter [Corynebacterium guangdongense]MDR7330153.1 cation diffusion facilitator family transporter [Corynebacterium guangdongense]WJZ18711.1 putative cation efflux system protein [Corynebacterium guangdongense]
METSHRHDHGHDHGHDHHHDHDHSAGPLARLKHALIPHSHDHAAAVPDSGPDSSTATEIGIRAAWISLLGMGVTAALQIIIVALSGSVGLLADTVHNLGHLVTTIPLIIAFRLGRRAATRRYNHGFGRAEDVAGLFIGGVVAFSAALIIWESVAALSESREMTNLGWVMAAALIGAAGNEIVAIYRIRAGRRIGSAALIAEGQHARTDALTSLAVAVGVIGAWAGLPWLDPLVGLIIAAVILGVLVQTMRTVFQRLMDGVDPAVIDRTEHLAGEVPGVRSVASARARWSGHRLLLEVEVGVDPGLSVSEADAIAGRVRECLLRGIGHVGRATVGVVPATRGDGQEKGRRREFGGGRSLA